MTNNSYFPDIESKLVKAFPGRHLMHIPRISKVCINVGIGNAKYEEKFLDATVRDLSVLAGQKAVVTYAKKSISSFKVRTGFPVGCKVTLRKGVMMNFIARLIYIALPDEKDFLGFKKKSLNPGGTLSFGIKEHIVFPEVNYDKVYKIFGMDINVVTTARSSQETKALLECFDFPFINR